MSAFKILVAFLTSMVICLWVSCSKPKPEPDAPPAYGPDDVKSINENEAGEKKADSLDTTLPFPEEERGGSTSTENN